ncbi:MAG: oligopeptide/dipeptide ABC transporter ATP-binding protein, partial [Aristaeellaceae bacterium]
VEIGDSDTLFSHPAHPYTRALLDAAPVADYDQRHRRRMTLTGEAHSAARGGCAFRDRCPFAGEECARLEPGLTPVAGDGAHLSACDRAFRQEESAC